MSADNNAPVPEIVERFNGMVAGDPDVQSVEMLYGRTEWTRMVKEVADLIASGDPRDFIAVAPPGSPLEGLYDELRSRGIRAMVQRLPLVSRLMEDFIAFNRVTVMSPMHLGRDAREVIAIYGGELDAEYDDVPISAIPLDDLDERTRSLLITMMLSDGLTFQQALDNLYPDKEFERRVIGAVLHQFDRDGNRVSEEDLDFFENDRFDYDFEMQYLQEKWDGVIIVPDLDRVLVERPYVIALEKEDAE